MAVSNNKKDNEQKKFTETTGGEVAVRTIVEDFSIDNANINVDLDHTEDSVAIGDGTNLVGVDSNNELKVIAGNGLIDFKYDFSSLTENATSDVWIFKTGGSGGTTIATITIEYTSANKKTIQDITKT